HWVKDHRRLLANSYRCLKKNGALRFNFGADGNCSHFNKVAKAAIGLPQFSNYFRTFEWPWYMPVIDEYEKLVSRFPFREVKVWGEVADRYFPDEEMLIKWVDQPSIVPFLQCLPELEKPGFRDYVVKKMLEETLQNDGRCFETFRRINLLAKK
ncbi:MAG TPA: hypothetical protein VF318_04600, partial [Dehalococcoidales bacterium]